MNYPLITVPKSLNQNFSSMNLDEAKTYFEWFENIKNNRLELLCREVFGKAPYLKEEGLMPLYYFLRKNIYHEGATFEKTSSPHELDKPFFDEHLYNVSLNYFQIKEPTKSICFDISIYLGELLIQNIKNCRWDYEKKHSINGYAKPSIFQKGRRNHIGVINVPVFLILDIIKESMNKYPPKKEPHLVFENFYINCVKIFKDTSHNDL